MPPPKIVTKYEKAVPPEGLMQACEEPALRFFEINKDIYESRQDWLKAFCDCQAAMNRLIEWNTDKLPKKSPSCL